MGGVMQAQVKAQPGRGLADPSVDDGLAQVDGRHLGEIEIAGLVEVAVDGEGHGRKGGRLVDPTPAAGRGAFPKGREAEPVEDVTE